MIIERFKKLPNGLQWLLVAIMPYVLLMLIIELFNRYTISELLGASAYIFLICSMYQENIIKLRIYGAMAGTCFAIQFALSDLPLINLIGQIGLIFYGLFKAYAELQDKKRGVQTNQTNTFL